jgi:hypothetical protein
MSAFDDEMTAMDAVIFDEFAAPAVYVYDKPGIGEQLVDTSVIVDESVEPYDDGYTEHYRQVLMATLPNPGVPLTGKNSLNISAGKYAGTYDIVKVISKNPSEVVVQIK